MLDPFCCSSHATWRTANASHNHAGNEVVGCYDGEVDRTADVPDSVKAVAAQRKASGTFIDRPVRLSDYLPVSCAVTVREQPAAIVFLAVAQRKPPAAVG